MPAELRLATLKDTLVISDLIQLSAQVLGSQYYNNTTINSALQGAFGVDTQLIKDNTYYVIENNGQIIACGGWSFRKTLFGSDSNNKRDPIKLNPNKEAAKIRAFFIHPKYSRQGLGSIIIQECESKALAYGFNSMELMSTLSGIFFYQKHGYAGSKYINHRMNDGTSIKFLPMQKSLK